MSPILQPKEGISIYDEDLKRMIHYKNPYGPKARRAYKKLIIKGTPAEFVLPPGLKHHPPSHTSSRHTFYKMKPKKPKTPSIMGRTTYKNFLASFTLHNEKDLHNEKN
eukprot:SAG31_NODE_13_length_37961_cov_21.751307_32_plen_108_part_00